jgi:hypothetical protein
MKKRNKIALGVAGGVAAVAVIASVSSSGSGTGHETVRERGPAAAAKQSAPEDSGPATSFKDGTYKVGTDIETGTYKTDGVSATGEADGCYWERARNDSGEMSAIITNNFNQGPDRVTVKTGEFFKVNGGCKWKLVR